MAPSPLVDPTVLKIAAAHQKTSAQVILNWEWSLGIPSNPRSMNATHMMENLSAMDFSLQPTEIEQLNALPQDYCENDDWYECALKPNATSI